MVELDEDDGREDDQRRRDGQADVGQRQELLELVGATLHRRQRRLRRPGSKQRHRVGLVSRTKSLLVDNFIEVLVDDDPRCQVSANRKQTPRTFHRNNEGVFVPKTRNRFLNGVTSTHAEKKTKNQVFLIFRTGPRSSISSSVVVVVVIVIVVVAVAFAAAADMQREKEPSAWEKTDRGEKRPMLI